MCKRVLVACVVVLAGCTAASKDDLRPFVAVSGYYALMEPQTSPTPPTPTPSPRACENCNGLGYLTDGTVRTVCPVCKGNKVISGAVKCPSGVCRQTIDL